jgi:hypothetical protein
LLAARTPNLSKKNKKTILQARANAEEEEEEDTYHIDVGGDAHFIQWPMGGLCAVTEGVSAKNS